MNPDAPDESGRLAVVRIAIRERYPRGGIGADRRGQPSPIPSADAASFRPLVGQPENANSDRVLRRQIAHISEIERDSDAAVGRVVALVLVQSIGEPKIEDAVRSGIRQRMGPEGEPAGRGGRFRLSFLACEADTAGQWKQERPKKGCCSEGQGWMEGSPGHDPRILHPLDERSIPGVDLDAVSGRHVLRDLGDETRVELRRLGG